MNRILIGMFTLLACCSANAESDAPEFQTEEITFKSTGDVTLSGTLTLPDGDGPYPAVVLLGGSERLDRSAIYRWANADSIVSHGIAVFSFDSPGRGKSEGNRWGRTHKERTDDALAAIGAILNRDDINNDFIGLYGASEGGVITFRAASESQSIRFVVAISAPVVPYSLGVDSKVRTLCQLSGLQGEPLEKLVTFNRLAVSLALGQKRHDGDELMKFVEKWNDPKWNHLISLLSNTTTKDREATKDSFVLIAQEWEGSEWFRKNRVLREFQKQAFQLMGIDMSDLGAVLDDPVSARSVVEFDSAALARISGKLDSPDAIVLNVDASREEDPVSFLQQIECPLLCIYGEKDPEMSEYPGIVREVLAGTPRKDATVKVFEGAGHQIEVSNGKVVTGKEIHKYRHKDLHPFILEWLLKRVRPVR